MGYIGVTGKKQDQKKATAPYSSKRRARRLFILKGGSP
jgi:hypothetical protein